MIPAEIRYSVSHTDFVERNITKSLILINILVLQDILKDIIENLFLIKYICYQIKYISNQLKDFNELGLKSYKCIIRK